MRIVKEHVIGVVVDIQERLLPVMDNNEQLLLNLKTLIAGLNALSVPILVTEQYKKGLGGTVDELLPLLTDAHFIEKLAFSCYDEPRFAETLELSKKRTVVIVGIETHVCVMQTAIDLKAVGYDVVVVEDCVSSRSTENKRIAIERMRSNGVIVTSYESLLFELCRFAGTETFKSISKLVK